MLNLFNPLTKLEKRRRKSILNGNIPKKAQTLFAQEIITSGFLDSLPLTALDFETTGLNFNEDLILSMGCVDINRGEIDFSSGFHTFINIADKVKSHSAVINHITPEMLLHGVSLNEALNQLIEHIKGRIIICHAAVIEKTFLSKALELKDPALLPLIFLDTLLLEKSFSTHTGNVNDLRLSSIRRRRKLPAYCAHNAFADSVATAEVFLAQVKEIYGNKRPSLLEIAKRCIN